jgi:hypothetical protein
MGVEGEVKGVYTDRPTLSALVDTYFFGQLAVGGELSDMYSNNPLLGANLQSDYGSYEVEALVTDLYSISPKLQLDLQSGGFPILALNSELSDMYDASPLLTLSLLQEDLGIQFSC